MVATTRWIPDRRVGSRTPRTRRAARSAAGGRARGCGSATSRSTPSFCSRHAGTQSKSSTRIRLGSTGARGAAARDRAPTCTICVRRRERMIALIVTRTHFVVDLVLGISTMRAHDEDDTLWYSSVRRSLVVAALARSDARRRRRRRCRRSRSAPAGLRRRRAAPRAKSAAARRTAAAVAATQATPSCAATAVRDRRRARAVVVPATIAAADRRSGAARGSA